jgi:hypothetical protein
MLVECEFVKNVPHNCPEAFVTDYVIIGGRYAYLNRRDKSHPGTIDVDILFKEVRLLREK